MNKIYHVTAILAAFFLLSGLPVMPASALGPLPLRSANRGSSDALFGSTGDGFRAAKTLSP